MNIPIALARMASLDAEPRFQHDCDKCMFLGQVDEYDLYRCENPKNPFQSHIARSGSEGPSYMSMPSTMAPVGPVFTLCAQIYSQIRDGYFKGPCRWVLIGEDS